MSTRRTLTAALATIAIAAPAATAAAQPADMHASTAIAAAKAQQTPQDLRSPDAADAALHPRKSPVVVNAPGATVVESQAKTTPVAPGQPTWAVHPKQLPRPAQPAAVAKADDGPDWVTIGIGAGLTLLLIGGIAALTARTRTFPRTRVSA